VRANQRLAAAHELGEEFLLRIAERQVAVGHHHHAVELIQVLRCQERKIQLLRILLIALDRRHLVAAGLAEFDDRLLGRTKAGVLVEGRMGEE
jgi:hypothetical protein